MSWNGNKVFVLLDILSDNSKYSQLSIMQSELVKRQVKYSFTSYIFSFKFVGTVFVSSSFDLVSASITLPQLIAELSIILSKYYPFLQLYLARFQI